MFDCAKPDCKAVGYFPNQGALRVSAAGTEVCFNTPGLFAKAYIHSVRAKPRKMVYLNAWHFFPQHLIKDADGKYRLVKPGAGDSYQDKEGIVCCSFPPPSNAPLKFIESELMTDYVYPEERWALQNRESKMPD